MSLPTHIELQIVTPERLLVQERVDDVEIPGSDGYFGVSAQRRLTSIEPRRRANGPNSA